MQNKIEGSTIHTQAEHLDCAGLAAFLGLSSATIRSLRSRDPEKLPLPFLNHPLRWRREAVIRWMERREQAEAERIERQFAALRPARVR